MHDSVDRVTIGDVSTTLFVYDERPVQGHVSSHASGFQLARAHYPASRLSQEGWCKGIRVTIARDAFPAPVSVDTVDVAVAIQLKGATAHNSRSVVAPIRLVICRGARALAV